MPAVSTIIELKPPVTGKRALMPVPNPRCAITGYQEDRPLWDELWLPAAESRVYGDGAMRYPGNGTARPSQTWIQDNLVDKFFGTVYDGGPGDDSRPLVVKYRHKHRNTTTFKEFKRLRENGNIVLNAMDVCEIKLTASPNLPRINAVKNGTFAVTHRAQLEGYPVLIETGCASHPLGLPVPTGAAAFSSAMKPQGVIVNHQWWIAGTSQYPLTESGLWRMGSLIAYALTQEDNDTSILTSTLCAARAGAVDLSTALAELPETVGSIWKACKFILNAYLETRRKVGRLNNKRDPAVTQAIADLWLQYRYGIMPNVYLIEDSLKYLAKGERLYQTERAGVQRTLSGFEVDGWALSDLEFIDRVYVKNRFGVDFLSPHLQTNLAVTAWEMVPLSFIIDWVLNIGDILGALSPTYGSIEEGVQYSRRCQTVGYLRHPDWIGSPVRVEVNAYNAWPVRDKYSEIGLNVSPAMTFKRWLDAAALSWSSFRKIYKSTLRGIR